MNFSEIIAILLALPGVSRKVAADGTDMLVPRGLFLSAEDIMKFSPVLRAALLAAVVVLPMGSLAQESTATKESSATDYVWNGKTDRTWDGAYFGGSLGHAGRGNDRVGLWDSTSGKWLGMIGTLRQHGTLARLHVGNRWMISGRYVLGAQVGLAFGNVRDTIADPIGGGKLSHDLKHALFVRGSAGRLLGPDFLGYLTAGLGYGKFGMSNSVATGPFAKTTYTSLGYTLGVGVEKALSDRLSVFGEYEYAQFGKKHVEDAGKHTEATPKWHSINVGLNYRF